MAKALNNDDVLRSVGPVSDLSEAPRISCLTLNLNHIKRDNDNPE
jgi:hypothetical protein